MTSMWLTSRSGVMVKLFQRWSFTIFGAAKDGAPPSHVFGTKSGLPRRFLREITGATPVVISLLTETVIREKLVQYGPLLLGFSVSKRFQLEAKPSTVFSLNEDEGPCTGIRHAMMVVGIKGDTLLVQNSWRKAPFVQMSIAYLGARGGKLSALPTGLNWGGTSTESPMVVSGVT